ncbi:MAG: DUF2780 domain-containing protein [Campylobacterales bacterium]|nr:DUF2780 domain-containing protein [Campylobacterales bacterium]
MKKWIVTLMSLLFLSLSAQASSLSSMLMDQLGVSEKQANGGAGTLLKYAKGNLGKEEYAQVASAIPDIGSLLGAAPKSGGGLGALASGLGEKAGLASLASQFGALGLDAGMISQFVPIILEYVKGSGGDSVMKLL